MASTGIPSGSSAIVLAILGLWFHRLNHIDRRGLTQRVGSRCGDDGSDEIEVVSELPNPPASLRADPQNASP
jgi:hypothetical protein